MKKTMTGICVVLAAVATAGSAHAETLWEALAQAYTTNPQIEGQRAALRALDENVSQATALFRPSIVAAGTYGKAKSNTTVGTSPETSLSGSQKTASVTATQSLFNGFSDFNQRRAADANVKAGRAQLDNMEAQVLLAAATVYLDVVRDTATLGLNDNNVQVLQRQLEASEDRFRVGEITRTDVAQSKARLQLSITQRTAAEAQLAASRANYESIMGTKPASLESSPQLPELPKTLDEAYATARDRNPQIVAAKEGENAARYNVKVAEGGLLPEIGAQGAWRYSSQPTQQIGGNALLTTKSWSIGAQITVPLYQSGAEYSRIRQAKELDSQRRVDILFAEREVMELVQSAWERVRATRAQIESTAAQEEAAKIALEGVRQEAAVGSRTTLDVLNAEQEYLDAQVGAVRAKRDQYVAAFGLLTATGQLNADTLALQVEKYDPVKHYDRVKNAIIGTKAGN